MIRFYKNWDSQFSRQTDLNKSCFQRILNNVLGKNILEVGCGKGLLCLSLADKYEVVACDFTDFSGSFTGAKVRFQIENLEKGLSFSNNEFDTVVFAHTLEHILNIDYAISELRRVANTDLSWLCQNKGPTNTHLIPIFIFSHLCAVY